MNFKERYEDYLMHYGVPGMRWGHRKSQAKGYKDEAVKRDRAMYGTRRVRKINSKMLKGASYMQARHEVGADEYKKGDRLVKAGRIMLPAGVATAGALALLGRGIAGKLARGAKRYEALKSMGGRDVSGGAIQKKFKQLSRRSIAASLASIGASGAAVGGYAMMRKGYKKKNRYRSYK